MVEQVDVKYTQTDDKHWVIEATSQLPISLIRQHMQFYDKKSGRTYNVLQIVDNNTLHPTAPYQYFVEVEAEAE